MKVKNHNTSDQTRLFPTASAWESWLAKNHRTSPGIWLRLAKKGSDLRSVTYAEALEIALCHGWIDGQKRGESEQAWLQRFLPRSKKSIWSKINRQKALALIASKRMKASGQEAIDAAKKNGMWDTAYDSPKSAQVPEDFQAALKASRQARDFFRGARFRQPLCSAVPHSDREEGGDASPEDSRICGDARTRRKNS